MHVRQPFGTHIQVQTEGNAQNKLMSLRLLSVGTMISIEVDRIMGKHTVERAVLEYYQHYL